MKLKSIVSVFILLVTMCAFALPAGAASPVHGSVVADEHHAPRWEQTQWFVRLNNGVIERRLWSNTFGRWITDWQPVNP